MIISLWICFSASSIFLYHENENLGLEFEPVQIKFLLASIVHWY